MEKFISPLVVELIGKNKWKVYEKFEFKIDIYDDNNINTIEVPVGFITDFATIPRIFWSIISPIDDHGKAAVLHDYLYHIKTFSRKEADIIFSKALDILDVNMFKIKLMFYAVRLFGWIAWNKKRLGDIKK